MDEAIHTVDSRIHENASLAVDPKMMADSNHGLNQNKSR